MKLGLFSDPHYSSAPVTCGRRYNKKSLEKMKEAYTFFEKEHCDLVICLGDLTDTEPSHEKEIENLKEIVSVFDHTSVPTLCLMGNHDAFTFEKDEFYALIGENHRPRSFNKDRKNFIFIDACYFSNGMHYMPRDTDWTDTYFPYPDELEKNLQSSTDDTYIFVHQNLDPSISSSHVLSNADIIRNILSKYSWVKAVFQGHYHDGHYYEESGIQYITLPAMCEQEKAYYAIDI